MYAHASFWVKRAAASGDAFCGSIKKTKRLQNNFCAMRQIADIFRLKLFFLRKIPNGVIISRKALESILTALPPIDLFILLIPSNCDKNQRCFRKTIIYYDIMNFAEILKALRTVNGLTQKQLGAKLNLTVSTVCDWEKNRSEPNIAQLIALSAIFSVPVDFIIGNTAEA